MKHDKHHADAAPAQEDVSGLKRTNVALKREKTQLRKRLAAAEEQLHTQQQQMALLRKEKRKEKQHYTGLLKQAKQDSSLQSIERKVEAAFLAQGGMQEAVTDVMHRAKAHITQEEEGMAFVAAQFDSVEEWVSYGLRYDAPHLFGTSQGTATQQGAVPSQALFDSSTLSLSEQAKLKKKRQQRL